MEQLINYLNYLNFPMLSLDFVGLVKAVIEIFIITFIIYRLILILQRTRAAAIMRGIGVFLTMMLLAYLFKFETIFFILKSFGTIILVALPIIFQPELRRALEDVGHSGFWSKRFGGLGKEALIKLLHTLVMTLEDLSIMKVGALIVIEQETTLDEYTKSGSAIGGEVSAELLKTIFFPQTYLHDGAVLVRGDKILAAGCFLPLSENHALPQEVGSRHRAALGITEITDAISLAVSEETGQISLAHNGKLIRNLKTDALRELLYSICFPQTTSAKIKTGNEVKSVDK